MDTHGNSPQPRQAAINGLAVAGFVALVAAGIWLAVYSTRFVPDVAGRIGSAAVSVSSLFTPASTTPTLSVVPTASTTIPFGTTASSTPAKPIEVIVVPPTASTASPKPIAGNQTISVEQIGTMPAAPYGLPDLTVQINAAGYLATSSASSFVASSTVPAGFRPAVHFTIKNIGTNVTSAWNFSASIPTQTSYVFSSSDQQILAPGDSIEYTLGFDQATTGTGKVISITANPSHTLNESTFNNNTASTTITVLNN